MGGGKSHMLVRFALSMSLMYPGNRGLIGRHEFLKLQTTTLEEFDNVVPQQLISKRYDSPPVYRDIRLPNWPKDVASRVYFRGLENWPSLGSEQYGWLGIDEASESSMEARDMLLTRLRHRLPRKVQDILKFQCWKCGTFTRAEWCPKGCKDKVVDTEFTTIGNDLKYVMMAASNPYPGWFEDTFLLGEKDETLAAREDIVIKFVQSRIKDNEKNLRPGYEAMLRATLSPDMQRRMIDGEFGMFEGLIYEGFDPRLHEWRAEIPKYTRVLGGLDFGNENSTAHHSAGLVALVLDSGRLLLVDEFKDRGPDILDRQMQWMVEMEQKWASPIRKRVEWVADRTQMTGIQLMRKSFILSASKGGRDSVATGIKSVARLLSPDGSGRPGLYYLADCKDWREEIRKYRRDPKTLEVVKKDDHLMDAMRYMIELKDRPSGDPGRLLRNLLPTVR